MTEEEKKAIEYLKGYKYDNEVREAIDIFLDMIDEYKVACSCGKQTEETLRNIIQKQQEEIENLKTERDYYKARYNEFNNAFIEGGKKLTSK